MGDPFIIEDTGTPPPIPPVATSTAMFLGETARGPIAPCLVTSFAEFARRFGTEAPASDAFLSLAARGFFENGGTRLLVRRVVSSDAATASMAFGPLTIRANSPGAWGNHISVTTTAPGGRIRLAIACAPAGPASPAPTPEVFDDLDLDPASARNIGRVVSAESTIVTAEIAPGHNIDSASVVGAGALSGGTDGTRAPGHADFDRALAEADDDEVSLIYAPYPRRDADDIARAVIAHGEGTRARFAVVDPAPSTPLAQLTPRTAFGDSSFAACYYPWLQVAGTGGGTVTAPPGGHVLGIYARVDRDRGVFHAPANESLQGVTAVASPISKQDQDDLQPRGVNAIREFPGRGLRVWGSRTLSADAEWKYVQVRRLFIFLERSIDKGTQWVVFEPNGESLWSRVRDTIRTFLRTQWIAGALLGSKEEEAFFVRCDRTTMTENDLDNGRLVVLIGVAPAKPAEFVIFRIGQWTADRR